MEGINDPRELLVCARYEFFRGEPVEQAYKKFCAIVGNEAMTYSDFDFWFYQFKAGNFDLDFERSKNPPKELGDMPVDIMEEIFENLKWKEKAICRKVSGTIRKIIDNMKYSIEYIKINPSANSISLEFDLGNVIEYKKMCSGCLITWNYKKKAKIIDGADFRQLMCTDLKTALNNPKLRLDTFVVLMSESAKNRDRKMLDIPTLFSSIGHQLNVKRVNFLVENPKKVLGILSHLKPRTLEKIELLNVPSSNGAFKLKIDKLFDVDQWKKAKIFETEALILDFKIEHFLHFNKIRANIDSISKEDVIRLKNTILASADFESYGFWVKSDESVEGIIEIFGEELFEKLPIPGSTSYIRVFCDSVNHVLHLVKLP